jgi:hypothetical protein
MSMRAIAGFPKEPGHYFLKRALAIPPQSLLKEVFPEVDDWLEKHTSNQVGCNLAAGTSFFFDEF